MDVIDARADLVRIFEIGEALEQLHVGARRLDGDHVGIERCDRRHDVVEFAVAHVRVDLRRVGDARSREPEAVDRPFQVCFVLDSAQRQSFAQSGLVDLNEADTRFLEIERFIPDRESDLLTGDRARLIVPHEGPLKNGDGACQHALHGPLGQRLRIGGPFDGHRLRARDVAEDHRRFHVARAVRLHPPVLREREAGELLAEILDHVIALELAVDEHVDIQLFLDTDGFLRLLAQELVICRIAQVAALVGCACLAHGLRLRERSDRRRRESREAEGGPLLCTTRLK